MNSPKWNTCAVEPPVVTAVALRIMPQTGLTSKYFNGLAVQRNFIWSLFDLYCPGSLASEKVPAISEMEVSMKIRALLRVVQIAMAGLVLSISVAAQAPPPSKLSGTVNDYNPFDHGQYEMRGPWSLTVQGDSGTAAFSAALDLEHSDLWMVSNGITDTTLRDSHTHHISMSGAQVIFDQSSVASNCPTAKYGVPTTTGFAVVGMASVTGNGGFPPFAPHGELSPLTVCVTGGTQVAFSNVTLVFGLPASKHLGTQTINGVVGSVKP